MTLGRALAAAVYLLATLFWAGAMALSRGLGCEGGCAEDELHRLDVSLVLGLIGLAVAAAGLLGSVVRRWLGLSFLGMHVVVFAINLGIFWSLADSSWVFIPLAGFAAAAGYIALGGPGLPRVRVRS